METREFLNRNGPGLAASLAIAAIAWLLVEFVPDLKIVGAPVIAILAGMVIFMIVKRYDRELPKTSFTSKYVLQASVVLLGFGLNISTVLKVGADSLPIILSTITVSLVAAYVMYKILHAEPKTATLVGVGSSICGGSAIAATAPVIKAEDHVIAQSIAVIFLFNVLAALIFPTLGGILGMSDSGFALFAGTAINDTSSVTAAASTWDTLHGTGHAVLDSAAIVKLTRTLFIIPIVIVLSYIMSKKESSEKGGIKRAFPKFILFFIAASLITTVTTSVLTGDALGLAEDTFSVLKKVSSFLIVTAMAAIGLNTDLVNLLKTGGKTLIIGSVCWICIIISSLTMQSLLGLW